MIDLSASVEMTLKWDCGLGHPSGSVIHRTLCFPVQRKNNIEQDFTSNYILSFSFDDVSLNEKEFENTIRIEYRDFLEKQKWKKLIGAGF